MNSDTGGDSLHQPAHVSSEPVFVRTRLRDDDLWRGADGFRRQNCEHVRGRVPDTEQAALTLGEDLEVHRGLVEARVAVLELPQRRPLRFADGLARRLDAELVRHWSRRRSSAPFPGCAGFLRIRPK